MASSSCSQVLKHNWASSTSRFTATLNQGCLLQQGQEPAPLGHDSVGGTQTPPSFTEFSGFVLSALAMENLCFCMCACVGGPCLTPSLLLYSPVPSLFWWSWGFAAPQSHNTTKNLCVPTGGRPARNHLGSVPCPVSGAVSSLWVVEEKGGEAFSALQISVIFTSQSSGRQCYLFLVLGPN